MEQEANQDLFKFVVDKCYATIGAEGSMKNDTLFEDQCPRDQGVTFDVVDGKFRIDVEAFTLRSTNYFCLKIFCDPPPNNFSKILRDPDPFFLQNVS